MISRRRAKLAGKALNDLSAMMRKQAELGIVSTRCSEDVEKSVRIANAVIFQYYLIPRDIREAFFREELLVDGVCLQNLDKR